MLKKFIIALFCVLSFPLSAKPLIAASIRPLSLIATEISAGVADVVQVLPNGDVPHHYSMSFDDRRKLLEADLVLWIGPKLEGFYARAISDRPADSTIALADLVKSPGGGNPTSAEDPHLWLNPDYGLLMADALQTWLKKNYPESSDRIEANFRNFREHLKQTEEDITLRLAPFADRRYAAGHGAFVHFANFFGLTQVAAMERSSGVSASIEEISVLLRQRHIKCFVVEPQYRQQRAERMAGYLGARISVVDPLGVDIKKVPGAYGQLIATVGRAFAECLAGRQTAD